ncbi:hypothetical protein QQ045_015060 [Rhodiola kirilowii]
MNYRRQQQAIEKFRSVVSHCGLFDIGFRGYKYTYSNKRRGADEIKSLLDRALADRQCLNKFARHKAPPLFKFERMWLTHDTFKPTVKEEWSEVERQADVFRRQTASYSTSTQSME